MDQEFHDSAIICYNNATGEVQNLAKNFFNSMDTNGDGRISRSEFLQFLGKFNNTQWIQELFQSIDQNGDGSLDFVEFLTPFYFQSISHKLPQMVQPSTQEPEEDGSLEFLQGFNTGAQIGSTAIGLGCNIMEKPTKNVFHEATAIFSSLVYDMEFHFRNMQNKHGICSLNYY